MIGEAFQFRPRLVVVVVVAILCLANGAVLYAQQSGCEKCHTDEGLLKNLFKPARAAPSEEGEG
jgi:hypothetical protein